MLIGAHSIIYSTSPDADRAFLRDALKLPSVDGGEGWLIFGLPPAEVAVHPSNQNDVHEFYLMCDDVEALVAEMKKRNIACGPVHDQGWGLLTQVTLPGGGKLGIYQPRHARPKAMSAGKAAKKPARRATKKAAKKPGRKTKRFQAVLAKVPDREAQDFDRLSNNSLQRAAWLRPRRRRRARLLGDILGLSRENTGG